MRQNSEAERISLYNDLCDYEQELHTILFPPQTKALNIISRAIAFVRDSTAKWIVTDESTGVYNDNGMAIRYIDCTCSACNFKRGQSDFKYCPNCRSKMVIR